jgi:soluble lytic murein transglycosylase
MLLFRSLVVLALIVVFSLSASGTSLFPLPDQALQQASVYFRDKDYGRAREAALKAPQSGVREFMVGMTCIRQEQWQDAIAPLGYAIDNFPLLGDYALYNQALAFARLGKHQEALATINRMLRAYPQSPIKRAAATLQGNELYDSGLWKEALASYTDFIEDYPQGADALAAMYRSALCREQLGDPAAAAATLRTITINYPASSLTPKALLDLERLAQKGAKAAPLTAAEMLRQGNLLFDLGKYEQAVKTLDSALQKTSDPETAVRIKFKKGQALFKWRHYKDAEQLFATLVKGSAG